MLPIAKRAACREFRAFVAIDTAEVLADRIEAMLALGRDMTLVHRYIDSPNAAPKVWTNQYLDGDRSSCIRRTRGPDQHGITVYLAPGHQHFGFHAVATDGTEREVAARFNSEQPRDATLVEITGSGEGPGIDDQVVITAYNNYDVGQQWVLAFQRVESRRTVDADGDLVDSFCAFLASHGHDDAATDLARVATRRRWTWESIPEVLAYLADPAADPNGL